MSEPQVTIPLSALQGLTDFLSAIGVPVTPAKSESEEVPDLYFRSLAKAEKAYPEIYGSAASLRWKLRNRKTNGLLDCGAVVEKRSKPDQSRPSLVIVHREWVKWARQNQ